MLRITTCWYYTTGGASEEGKHLTDDKFLGEYMNTWDCRAGSGLSQRSCSSRPARFLLKTSDSPRRRASPWRVTTFGAGTSRRCANRVAINVDGYFRGTACAM